MCVTTTAAAVKQVAFWSAASDPSRDESSLSARLSALSAPRSGLTPGARREFLARCAGLMAGVGTSRGRHRRRRRSRSEEGGGGEDDDDEPGREFRSFRGACARAVRHRRVDGGFCLMVLRFLRVVWRLRRTGKCRGGSYSCDSCTRGDGARTRPHQDQAGIVNHVSSNSQGRANSREGVEDRNTGCAFRSFYSRGRPGARSLGAPTTPNAQRHLPFHVHKSGVFV